MLSGRNRVVTKCFFPIGNLEIEIKPSFFTLKLKGHITNIQVASLLFHWVSTASPYARHGKRGNASWHRSRLPRLHGDRPV